MPADSLNNAGTARIIFIIISAFSDAEFAVAVNAALAMAFLSCMLSPGAVKTDAQ